jgi:hypothetical protein
VSDPILSDEEREAGIEVDGMSAEEQEAGIELDPPGPVMKTSKLGREETTSLYEPGGAEEMRLRAEGAQVVDRRLVDAATLPEGAPRMTQLAPMDIAVDPRTGDTEYDFDPDEARNVGLQTVLQTPRSVQRRAGTTRQSDEVSPLAMMSGGAAPAMAAAGGQMGAVGRGLLGGMVGDDLGAAAVARHARYSPGAMAAGAGDMLTMGFGDEIGGAIRADDEVSYEQARDTARERHADAAATNPGSYGLGMAGGMAALVGLPGPAQARALQGAGNAGARIGAAVGEGTALGALSGAGRSEADPDSLQFLDDTASGGVIGGLTAGSVQGGGEGVGALLRRLDPEKLRVRSALLRLRAMFGADNPPRGPWREMTGTRGGRSDRVVETLEDLQAAGVRRAGDAPDVNDAAGESMRRAAESLDDAAARQAAQRAPRVADDVAGEAVPSAGAGPYRDPGAAEHVVDPQRIADRIRERAQELQRTRGVGPEVVGGAGGHGPPTGMEAEAIRWEQAAAQPMTFQRAWEFRQEMGRPEYWTVGPRGTMSPAHAYRRDLYSIIREEMQRAADAVDPALASQFREGARRFAVTRPLSEAADEALLRSTQNRQVGLTDTIAATAGMASGGIGGGALAVGLNKLLRGNEHKIAAGGLDMIRRAVERNPGALGPYGTILQTALRRGPGIFAASWYALSRQHPELQQRVQDMDDPDTDIDTAEAEESY